MTSANLAREVDRDERIVYDRKVAALREIEYPMLKGTTYLDHAGTTLPSKSLVDAFSAALLDSLLGNPHSASTAPRSSSQRVENCRVRVLRLFGASPEHFDVVFVANATAGIKLVVEAFRDWEGGFWYGYHRDAHTSLVGARESAVAGSTYFASDDEVDAWLCGRYRPEARSDGAGGPGLFAYPAQSNMNGRRLPLSWPGRLRGSTHDRHRHIYSLLDAAALVSTAPLALGDAAQAPDFTVLSFYKIFGFPDLGALIVRKEAGHVLRKRKYFGGGTVDMVACEGTPWHMKKQGPLHEQLEDGTLPIHSILALDCAIDAHEKLFDTLAHVSRHTAFLAQELYDRLRVLKHGTGVGVCEIYREPDPCKHGLSYGPVIAFNVRNSRGGWISGHEIEKLAAVKNIQLRTGGLCNPGGTASSLKLSPQDLKKNFSSGQRCGNESEISCDGPTEMVRVSFGAMSTTGDIDAFTSFIGEFFVEQVSPPRQVRSTQSATTGFFVESLMVYPIKSCGGWQIPRGIDWIVRPEGLEWDREWCLVHQGSRAALSQKRYAKMALIKPRIDFESGLLRVGFRGPIPSSVPAEIAVPLSPDPLPFTEDGNEGVTASKVCGDSVRARVYASPTITSFFSAVLDVPCYLARFPAQGPSGPSVRHAKAHLQRGRPWSAPAPIMPGSFPVHDPPRPILLSNESPILTVSRSSLNRLNEAIRSNGRPGKTASAAVFRANVILAEDRASSPGIERAYIEDTWRSMRIGARPDARSPDVAGAGAGGATTLEVLGPCRRCQMVCVDQSTGERNEEPFVSLARTRRTDGMVWFGVHTGLPAGESGTIAVGDGVEGIT